MNKQSIRQVTIGRRPQKRAGFFSRFRFGKSSRNSRTPQNISPRGGRPNNKKSLKTFLSYALIVCAGLFLAGGIAVVALIAWVSGNLPDPNNLTERLLAQSTRIYDRTGEHMLYEVHGNEKRTVVELDDISPHLINATIAIEDRDFYTHSGFSVTGILRSVYKNFRSGDRVQGGSTITQQFVKNAILSNEKTYIRKVRELIMSLEIERRFSKQEILKMYLNEIPYGSVLYGIQAASESFFGKHARDLALSEAALIASIPQSATYFSPHGPNTDALLHRSHIVLDAMVAQGMITRQAADDAKADDVLSRIVPRSTAIIAPHFVFYVRDALAREFGDQSVEQDGLRVITTLDYDLQLSAEEAITNSLPTIQSAGGNTAALLAINPKNGDMLSMVGSANYFDNTIRGQFNALTGLLQPGSSIKPIVYAAAFERGYTPNTVLFDVPTRFGDYEPRNYGGSVRGPMTMRESLAGSLNIPAVKTLYLAGMDHFLNLTDRLGYSTFADRDRFGLSISLGGAAVRPIEHISAFGAFATGGLLHESRAILRVENSRGEVLYDAYENDIPATKVMEPKIAHTISTILADNGARAYVFGAQSQLNIPERSVAVKTGTTNENKDAWTVGYTPSLVTGVWVGNADGTLMGGRADGSVVAAPIWNAFMRVALADTPVEYFPGVEQEVTGKPVLDGEKATQIVYRIDRISGKLATEYTPEELIEERGFGEPHSILHFVDRRNPRGPVPENPAEDPMYESWEAGVLAWAETQEDIEGSSEPAPTEYDDIHTPAHTPVISVSMPADGQTVTDRTIFVSAHASSLRGVDRIDFSIDGYPFATLRSPFMGTITIPNRFSRGFHTVTATAYDDVLNRASTSFTINLAANPLPLNITWRAPQRYGFVSSSQFPYTVLFTVSDLASIRELTLTAERSDGHTTTIGVIEQPALPNMALSWNDDPESGQYTLRLSALLMSGETTEDSISILVQ